MKGTCPKLVCKLRIINENVRVLPAEEYTFLNQHSEYGTGMNEVCHIPGLQVKYNHTPPAFKILNSPPTHHHTQTTQEPAGGAIFLLFSLRG